MQDETSQTHRAAVFKFARRPRCRIAPRRDRAAPIPREPGAEGASGCRGNQGPATGRVRVMLEAAGPSPARSAGPRCGARGCGGGYGCGYGCGPAHGSGGRSVAWPAARKHSRRTLATFPPHARDSVNSGWTRCTRPDLG